MPPRLPAQSQRSSHPRPEGQNGGDEFADGRSSISYHSSGNYLAKARGALNRRLKVLTSRGLRICSVFSKKPALVRFVATVASLTGPKPADRYSGGTHASISRAKMAREQVLHGFGAPTIRADPTSCCLLMPSVGQGTASADA